MGRGRVALAGPLNGAEAVIWLNRLSALSLAGPDARRGNICAQSRVITTILKFSVQFDVVLPVSALRVIDFSLQIIRASTCAPTLSLRHPSPSRDYGIASMTSSSRGFPIHGSSWHPRGPNGRASARSICSCIRPRPLRAR